MQHLYGLGKARHVTLATEADITPAAMTYTTRQIVHPELWCDTSESLTASDYAFLAGLGVRGQFMYVEVATTAMIQAALNTRCPDGSGFALAFVQFARTSGINAANGQVDGQAALTKLKALSVPNKVWFSQDLYPSDAASCIAYSNASYNAMVTGWLSTSLAMYAEPGYPLSAADRYSKLFVHGYWATAAADPQRFPTPRGCQVVQCWGSSRGEWFPRQGLVIDTDLVQFDWFNAAPIVLCAA